MEPATDCRQRQENQKTQESLPPLLTVGDLAVAAHCTKDTALWFLRKNEINPAQRAGNYRLYSHNVLAELRQELDRRKRA